MSLRTLSRRLALAIPTRVYTVDLRNHGESAKRGVLPHTYELMSMDIVQFIRDHRLNNVVLAGHSMYSRSQLWFTEGEQKLRYIRRWRTQILPGP
jgi:pimeloyl-ACP methyl ester carboxylesterase